MTSRFPLRTWAPLLIPVVVGLVALYVGERVAAQSEPEVLSYSAFVQAAREGRFAEVTISDEILTGRPKDASGSAATTNRIAGASLDALIDDLGQRGVVVRGENAGADGWVPFWLAIFLPSLFLLGLYALGSRLMSPRAGALTFGKNQATIYDRSTTNRVTFADVAGVDEAEAELVEVVDFLKHPDKYRRLGGRIPKGVLLVGPPGTGKTLLAKAVAGESGVPFFSISGSEFVEMFVGVGAARVRDLFAQATERAPCIVFIDELDAVGKSRAAGRGMLMTNDEREQTLNQLLAEMDGFDSSKAIIIMAATNAPEVLDPALLRAGRFDRQVLVDRPDVAGREAILRVHARALLLDSDVDLHTIAARTPGMVGADLANVLNEAALLAARHDGSTVAMRDIEEAIDRVMLGLEKKARVMSPAEKARVAVHEAGHALVALSLPDADPVHRVSIIPRAVGALGHTLQLPAQDRYILTQPELEARLTMLLGGRTAEELTYDGVVSTGAADDLERASELARQMITRFGMSQELGPVTYGRPLGARFLDARLMAEQKDYSERLAERIDGEVRRLLDQAHDRSHAILVARRAALDALTANLIKRETLSRAEIEALTGAASASAAFS